MSVVVCPICDAFGGHGDSCPVGRLESMTRVADWAIGYILRVGGYMAPEHMRSLQVARRMLESEQRTTVISGGKGDAP